MKDVEFVDLKTIVYVKIFVVTLVIALFCIYVLISYGVI